ncbi:hypothetical protein [Streptomyces misionensis]|uniref:hypothetical protein n=1 Tax=Streptomyces misionensis TaxID=67331 RepID=UPI000AD6A051|nr:hypothetical protein [Streptomyces misionensis]
MRRGQAAEIARGATVDVGDVTTRFLPCGLLPGWCAPGLADWATHRRTRVEDTAGLKESLTARRSAATARHAAGAAHESLSFGAWCRRRRVRTPMR